MDNNKRILIKSGNRSDVEKLRSMLGLTKHLINKTNLYDTGVVLTHVGASAPTTIPPNTDHTDGGIGNTLWIDDAELTSDDASKIGLTLNDIADMRYNIAMLESQVKKLMKLITTGVIPGNVMNSYRRQIMSVADPVAPDGMEEIPDEEDDSKWKPDTTIAGEYTVFHNACKLDTVTNFAQNVQDLIDGDLIFATDQKKLGVYYKGRFYFTGGAVGPTLPPTVGPGSGDNIWDMENEFLKFKYTSTVDKSKLYRVACNDSGNWFVRPWEDDPQTKAEFKKVNFIDGTADKVYVNCLLNINTIYFGGEYKQMKDNAVPTTKLSTNKICSHSFIELSNGSNKDINLNNIFLLYTDNGQSEPGKVFWKKLPLTGIIPAYGTFLIRGKRCSARAHNIIEIKNYDIDWPDTEFNYMSPSFILCCGPVEGKEVDLVTKVDKNALNNIKDVLGDDAKTPAYGYIDGFGMYSEIESTNVFFSEGNAPLKFPNESKEQIERSLFIRWFSLETAKQGNKAYSKRKTDALWDWIDFDKNTSANTKVNKQYWTDEIKMKYAPKASFERKNFFTSKTTFNKEKPNYVISSLGKEGTDNSTAEGKYKNNGASRCFNWVSVGYYNEYVEYRKVGESVWNKMYSFSGKSSEFTGTNEDFNDYMDFYKRFSWQAPDGTYVTTHKAIVRGLKAGVYEYRIRRDNSSYSSDTFRFVVYDYKFVEDYGLHFVHISDQQGFNFMEYGAWREAADVIYETENIKAIETASSLTDLQPKETTDVVTPYFTINTGDISQSGNRHNEWLDYYNNRFKLSGLSEMVTIGNNDLSGYDETELSDGNDAICKFNHININRYYCFELDPKMLYTDGSGKRNYYTLYRNPIDEDNTFNEVPIYSMYAFNFGKFHFVCLNSELTINYYKSKMGLDTIPNVEQYQQIAKEMTGQVEEFFLRDMYNNGLRNGTVQDSTDYNAFIKNITATETPAGKDTYVFMHEMPFTILTNSNITNAGNSARGGSHLNTENVRGTYRFSRLFRLLSIPVIMGGHKHTYSLSGHVYDAPEGYTAGVAGLIDKLDGSGTETTTIDATMQYLPVIEIPTGFQVKPESDPMPDLCSNANFAGKNRYAEVDWPSAPVYVMSQATGYKLVSNKELPVNGGVGKLPWMYMYYPNSNPKDNKPAALQKFPMYVRYDAMSNALCKITNKKCKNIYSAGGTYKPNERITDNAVAEELTIEGPDSGVKRLIIAWQNKLAKQLTSDTSTYRNKWLNAMKTAIDGTSSSEVEFKKSLYIKLK